MISDVMDYLRFYYLENYLFEEVRLRFLKNRFLSADDFFCIVIWKANRSKSKIGIRLLGKGYGSLEAAVKDLTLGIFHHDTSKEKLKYLMVDWGINLPMASAILTIFYTVPMLLRLKQS